MTATLPDLRVASGLAHTESRPASWLDDALAAVMALAPLLVPGCQHAFVETVGGDHPPDGACGDAIRIALVSGPMNGGGELLGVLNLLGDDAFGPDAAEPARLLAQAAAAILSGDCEHRSRMAQMERAVQGRDVIGQAKGILMAESGVDADTAFRMLVRASQRENRKLRDLAAEIVARRSVHPGGEQ